ncbi:MAG TPA: c-type cytochrome [Asticcacaulis sp.]
MKRFLPLLLLVSACSRPDAPLRAPDLANGRRQFAACAGCHSLSPGVTVFGPSLYSVYGRKAGSLAGYDYSPAMRAYGKAWDEAALDAFLASPGRTVPGTRMGFWGMRNAQDRRDLIAFLKNQP